ncbi:integrase [Oleiphilus sp. HI0068]|uniref:site-specific integrase n=1 Tax=Oleiphilus sp. HI0132 TaxID=1822270 RepID=UPI0007C326E0|nr:site-specific integrase [Oleiphilus sp. HI0132]KZY77638.1 integrase [Oleiphilus sp. HI0068]KZY83194.1 integrase [Oleiphilus sp. HI0069]KZZ41226.1 integrase [Oleiphilus sp. HI0085]KZZ75895.1 integrase [Oleiphilus sp. HI0132]KZZ80690.1 integrase [Oleiphilus sp. HI0132]
MSKAEALSKKEIRHALAVANLMTHKEGKRCALVLSHAAMRVSEIALIETGSLLNSTGELRKEIHLPAKICKRLKPRTIWLTNPVSREIIQDWIEYRLKKKWGTVIGSAQYQGLNPNSRFLYNNRGRPYAMTEKKRVMYDGSTKSYRACDSLEHLIRAIYTKAGFHNASSHTGRKSLITNAIIDKGISLKQAARILGHSNHEQVLSYITISKKRLSEMYEEAL